MSFAKIAAGLRRLGHRPVVIAGSAVVARRFRALGLSVEVLRLGDTGWREIRALVRMLRRERAGVILGDTRRDVRLAAYATLLWRIPTVYRYNVTGATPRLHLVDRFYFGRVTATVFQSEYIEARAWAENPSLRRSRRFRIPNGIDTARFVPSDEAGARFRAAHRIPPGVSVLVTGSMLAPKKGQDIVLSALARLRPRGGDIWYVLCGDGPEASRLEARARALGVSAVFPGLLTPEAMQGAFCAADIVVHPATTEIFPNAVAEAMACERPVIGAKAGGLPEVLGQDGSTGVLVPPDDDAALAGAIARLTEAPALRRRLGRAARQRVVTQFPLDRMEHAYADMFHNVVTHAEGRRRSPATDRDPEG